ncbi:MAG: DUF1697 domain-containing protein [Microthrixaceae bacterium]
MIAGPTYVAFVRAVNVGGRTATKERLIAAAEAIGATHVSTFLASGNVLLAPGALPGRRAALESALERALEAELGFHSEVFVRTRRQLAALGAGDPWDGAVDLDSGTYNVAFLHRALPPTEQREILACSTPRDHLAVVGTELHWHTAGKMSESELFDRPLLDRPIAMTMRNIRTVKRLVARLDT